MAEYITEPRLIILYWYPISPIVLHKEKYLKKETSPFSSQPLYLIGLVNHKEKIYFDHSQGVNHDNSKESRESHQRCLFKSVWWAWNIIDISHFTLRYVKRLISSFVMIFDRFPKVVLKSLNVKKKQTNITSLKVACEYSHFWKYLLYNCVKIFWYYDSDSIREFTYLRKSSILIFTNRILPSAT